MTSFRRILHATDFSRASAPAFARALALATEHGAELILAHVLMPPDSVLEDAFLSARAWRDLEQDRLKRAGMRLAPLIRRALDAGVKATPVVLQGIPADEIVSAARRFRADLIVIGTHGRTGLARLLMGSVAQRVLGLAACPVMTVRSSR